MTTEQVHQRLQIPLQVLRDCQIDRAVILENYGLILAHVKRNGWIIAKITPKPNHLQDTIKLTTEQVSQRLQISSQVLRSNCKINQALIFESDGLILAHVKHNG